MLSENSLKAQFEQARRSAPRTWSEVTHSFWLLRHTLQLSLCFQTLSVRSAIPSLPRALRSCPIPLCSQPSVHGTGQSLPRASVSHLRQGSHQLHHDTWRPRRHCLFFTCRCADRRTTFLLHAEGAQLILWCWGSR